MVLKVSALLALAASVALAQVFPYTPSEVLRSGKTYELSWKIEAGWNETTISLFSGGNDITWDHALQNITTLDASVEGTYQWEVPEVAPCASIYFLQFSQPGQQFIWTGRFAICDKDDEPVPGTAIEGGATFGSGSIVAQPTGKPKKGKKDKDDDETKSGKDKNATSTAEPTKSSNVSESMPASSSTSGNSSATASANESSSSTAMSQSSSGSPTPTLGSSSDGSRLSQLLNIWIGLVSLAIAFKASRD